MPSDETLCPQCHKMTRTILGGCPNCGGPKENPVYFPPRIAPSGSWFDDLPGTSLLWSLGCSSGIGVLLAVLVAWEWGLAALVVLGLLSYLAA